MNRNSVLCFGSFLGHVHPQQPRGAFLLRPVRGLAAEEAQQLHAAPFYSQSVQEILLGRSGRAAVVLIVRVLLEPARLPLEQLHSSSPLLLLRVASPTVSASPHVTEFRPQVSLSPVRLFGSDPLGVSALPGLLRSSRHRLQFPQAFRLFRRLRDVRRRALGARVRVLDVRQLPMKVHYLPAELLVLLAQSREYTIPLVPGIGARADVLRRRRLKPLSPPPDLVLRAARRVLFLRQWLQPLPAEETPQRAEAPAAEQLVHVQLRQVAVVVLRLLVGLVLRRQVQPVVILAERDDVARADGRRLGKSGTVRASDSLQTKGQADCHADACEAYQLVFCLLFLTI